MGRPVPCKDPGRAAGCACLRLPGCHPDLRPWVTRAGRAQVLGSQEPAVTPMTLGTRPPLVHPAHGKCRPTLLAPQQPCRVHPMADFPWQLCLLLRPCMLGRATGSLKAKCRFGGMILSRLYELMSKGQQGTCKSFSVILCCRAPDMGAHSPQPSKVSDALSAGSTELDPGP